jgi:hypothetical protein
MLFKGIMGFVTTHHNDNVQVLSTIERPAKLVPTSTSTTLVKMIGYHKHSIKGGNVRVIVCQVLNVFKCDVSLSSCGGYQSYQR